MTKTVQWILASRSPRRRELLQRICNKFTVISPDVSEWEPERADPVAQVEENALRKGRAVAQLHPDARIIAADTTVALGNRLFAKPCSTEDARRMLRALSGQKHRVVTGIALLHGGFEHCFHAISSVQFRDLDNQRIDDYISRVNVFDKAGAYAIQEQGEIIIDHYEGSFENIMGLPVQRLQEELVQLGWMSKNAFDE